MKFTEERLKDFLEDKPFFENKECYCLGENLEDAAEIVAKIIGYNRKVTSNVEMDNG